MYNVGKRGPNSTRWGGCDGAEKEIEGVGGCLVHLAVGGELSDQNAGLFGGRRQCHREYVPLDWGEFRFLVGGIGEMMGC